LLVADATVFFDTFNIEVTMSEHARILPEIRKLFEKKEFSRAIYELDELAYSNSAGKEYAARLYRTYHPKMLEEAQKRANEVISWSREHVLTPKEIVGKFRNLLSEMEEFEKEYDVKVENARTPSEIQKARQILDEEKRVFPRAMDEKKCVLIEKMLMDFYEQRDHEKISGKEWKNLSHNDRVLRIRSVYRENGKEFRNFFSKWVKSSLLIQMQKEQELLAHSTNFQPP